jgi:hypothetical protein
MKMFALGTNSEFFKVIIPLLGKSIHLPKRIMTDLRIRNGEYVYLELLRYKHPVAVCKNNVTLPAVFRKILRDKKLLGKHIPLRISRINNGGLSFVAHIYPHLKNGRPLQHCLTIHPLARKCKVVKIKVGDSYFYGTVQRGRVEIFSKIVRYLGINTDQLQQIEVHPTNFETANNRHILKLPYGPPTASEVVKGGFLRLDRLLSDFSIRHEGRHISISIKTMAREAKQFTINRYVKLNSTFFRILGLFQAEGTKKRGKCFYITNKDPRLLRYFILNINKLLGLNASLWRVDIQLASTNQRYLKDVERWWAQALRLPSNVTIHSYKTEKGAVTDNGVATAKVISRTFNEFIIRMMKFVREYVMLNKAACGYFISGVLAGDGYPQVEHSLKCVELYFDPNKVGDEAEGELYIKCLKFLGIAPISVRIFCDKNNKDTEQRAKAAAERLKELTENVTITYKQNINGVGGTIFIRGRENFQKLAPYRPFYPRTRHMQAFYDGLWVRR